MAGIRKVYKLKSLQEQDVNKDPIKQFEKWWQEAIDSKIEEPNAMTLATCDGKGKPSARIVLLKGIHKNDFVFFTNYESHKSKEIRNNPFVALVFFWKELERQIRIEGKVKKISKKESDDYFSQRPRESQLGAWSSPQSSVIKNAGFLQENFKKYNDQFGSKKIPRPNFWGGFVVEPCLIEFWQGRPGRLHDRIQYSLNKNNNWEFQRLAP